MVLGLLGRGGHVSSGIAQVHTEPQSSGKGVVWELLIPESISHATPSDTTTDKNNKHLRPDDKATIPLITLSAPPYARADPTRRLDQTTLFRWFLLPHRGHRTLPARLRREVKTKGDGAPGLVCRREAKKARNYYINKYLVPPNGENVRIRDAVMVVSIIS